jgi:hypothetical protein
LAVAFLVFSVLSLIASLCININRFSLHAMYRNRLVRAFLGAARRRHADRFSGFDFEDNVPLSNSQSSPEAGSWRPLHVINIALNLVSTSSLAWQERMAAPFTVSPLYSGSNELGYRDTSEYGGDTGLSLGTAMAISGAAASPNMGYYSSPAVTFLMSMLNVRLGWWLGNPGPVGDGSYFGTAFFMKRLSGEIGRWLVSNTDGEKSRRPITFVSRKLDAGIMQSNTQTPLPEPCYRQDGPDFAIWPLLQEAFGWTTEDRKFVYLSDGGDLPLSFSSTRS